MPPDLAELVFEVQEQLADMHDARADSELPQAYRSGAASSRRRWMKPLPSWSVILTKWDQVAPGQKHQQDNKVLTDELKSILSKIAYLRTLIRDVDRALENSKAA